MDLAQLTALDSLSIGPLTGDAARTNLLLCVLKDLSGLPQTYRDFSLAAGSAAPDVPTLARLVRGIFADSVSRGTPSALFSSRLAKAGVAEPLVAALAGVLYSERRGEVLSSALARVGVQLGGRALLAWDWSVRHVVSSSKVASLGDSLLHLSLTLGAQGDKPQETVTLELSPKESQCLVDALEAARAASLAC